MLQERPKVPCLNELDNVLILKEVAHSRAPGQVCEGLGDFATAHKVIAS